MKFDLTIENWPEVESRNSEERINYLILWFIKFKFFKTKLAAIKLQVFNHLLKNKISDFKISKIIIQDLISASFLYRTFSVNCSNQKHSL